MTAKPITESEWVAELEQLQRRSDSGSTMREIATRWGVSHKTACERVRCLQEKGRIVVGFRRTQTIAGRDSVSPVYRIKKGVK